MWAFIMLPCLMLAVSSCRQEPVVPNNENEEKLHEEPVKITLRLVECHLHGDWYKISTEGGPHANPQTPAKYIKRRQEMSYELSPSGWQLTKGSQKKFYVQQCGNYKHGKHFTPAPIYLMFIDYYNNKGELMNGQIVSNGQEHIHQHFFDVKNVKPTFDGKAEQDDQLNTNQIDYIYADTTPWDKTFHSKEAKLTGKENPLGFKGVVRFLRDRKEFDLRIRLYHGFEGKRNKDGSFSPWNKPSSRLIQRGTWDVDIPFPIVVFMSRNDVVDGIDEDTDVTTIQENSLDKDGNRLIQSIMKAFSISWTEACQEYQDFTYKSEEMESSHLWL